jgi:hypothetical protein
MKLRTQPLLMLPRITLCVALAALIGASMTHPAHAQLTEPTDSNVHTLPEITIIGDPPNQPGLTSNADGSIPFQNGTAFKRGETVYYRGQDYNVEPNGSQCTVGNPDYVLRPANQYTGPVCRKSTPEEIIGGRIISVLGDTFGTKSIYIRGTEAELDAREEEEQQKIRSSITNGLLNGLSGMQGPIPNPGQSKILPQSSIDPRDPTYQEPPR